MLLESIHQSKPGSDVQRQQRKKKEKIFGSIALAFRPYKGKVFLVLLTIILTTVLNLVVPLLIPRVFDDALAQRDMKSLFIYGLLMMGATVLAGIVGVAQTYLTNLVGQRVMQDFRDRLYAHLQDMSLRFFTSMRTGEIQSRLSNDITAAQNAVTDTFTDLMTNLITVLGTVVAMLYLSPALTGISFVFLPIFLVLTFRVGNVRRRSTRATQQSLASMNALTQETLSVSGILLIKTFGRKKFAQEQFSRENQNLTHLSIQQRMVGRWFFMLVNTFSSLMPVSLYIVAGWLMLTQPHSSVTIGTLIAFIALQGRFFGPFGQFLALQVNLHGSLAVFERIFEYLRLPVEISDAPNALRLAPAEIRGGVSFKQVSFTYKQDSYAVLSEPGGRNAGPGYNGNKPLMDKKPPVPPLSAQTRVTLKNIDFTIQPGQLVALVGPSGAGKTTITYLIPRLYDVESGAVEIDGHNVKALALDSLGASIGVVPQEIYLFHTTIRQNLLYVRPDATEEQMLAATRAAAIHDRIMELSDGYDTIVGERGYRLSGGEKQRLAIARVLLKDPRILILDEATSSLDTHSERLIQKALKPLMKGRTTIAIAHRLSTILAADMILVIEHGEIVERGTHKELLQLEGAYARLYNDQFASQIQEETVV